MTEIPTSAPIPGEDQPSNGHEVTFHLAPQSDVLPYRWVAGIDTPDGSWQHRSGITEDLEPLTVHLPERMSRNILDFARKHLGEDATDEEVDYWCHTFAREVGSTALSIDPSTAWGGEHGLADAQARILFSDGTVVTPSELAIGEHAVVGDANPHTSRRAPMHSMVGIGRPKGEADGPNLAVQVDTSRGNLYVGDPADYLADVSQSGAHLKNPPEPALYVQRTPKLVPANHRRTKS